MKRLLAFLAAGLLASVAYAAVLTATWTNATKNIDDTPIPASGPGSIASTRIEIGTCNGTAFGTKVSEFTVQGVATTGQTPNLQPGTWCARAAHTNTYGVEGVWSNVAQKTIAAPTPGAPTNFSLGS
jgi:hypothetical protein